MSTVRTSALHSARVGRAVTFYSVLSGRIVSLSLFFFWSNYTKLTPCFSCEQFVGADFFPIKKCRYWACKSRLQWRLHHIWNFWKSRDIYKMGTRSCNSTRTFHRCEEIRCLWNAKKWKDTPKLWLLTLQKTNSQTTFQLVWTMSDLSTLQKTSHKTGWWPIR